MRIYKIAYKTVVIDNFEMYIDADPPVDGAIVRFIDWPGRSKFEPTWVTWLVPDK